MSLFNYKFFKIKHIFCVGNRKYRVEANATKHYIRQSNIEMFVKQIVKLVAQMATCCIIT